MVDLQTLTSIILNFLPLLEDFVRKLPEIKSAEARLKLMLSMKGQNISQNISRIDKLMAERDEEPLSDEDRKVLDEFRLLKAQCSELTTSNKSYNNVAANYNNAVEHSKDHIPPQWNTILTIMGIEVSAKPQVLLEQARNYIASMVAQLPEDNATPNLTKIVALIGIIKSLDTNLLQFSSNQTTLATRAVSIKHASVEIMKQFLLSIFSSPLSNKEKTNFILRALESDALTVEHKSILTKNKDNLDPEIINAEKASWHKNQPQHSHDQNVLLTELLSITSHSTNGMHGMLSANHKSKPIAEKAVTQNSYPTFQFH